MTIKKPTKSVETETDELSAETGATIADRFKLDAPVAPAPKAGGIGTTFAVVAAVLALAVAGILTFVIYQHWQFLANA